MNDWTNKGWVKINTIIDGSDYDYSDEFRLWLSKNCSIWQGFANKTMMAHAGGHKHRFGAKAILEILRWETFLNDADGVFKINNNYAPDLARLIMDCKPELKGYFRIRGSEYRSDAA